MTDWQALIKAKREANAKKLYLYPEWRLDDETLSKIKPDSEINVLDIPRRSGVLTEKELELTENHDATALVALLASGKVSSYDLTLAFCKRAAIAQQVTNCITEIIFEEALEQAKWYDSYYKDHGKPYGPLHGLPISLKDSFDVKGVQSTIGYVSFLKHEPKTHDSVLVEILRNLGAVFYCKTNLPQSMMTIDSENHVFGRTLNPHKLSLTAGGSTGGEGALVAMRGSVLGMCTDIAGSARLPALCDGIYGFKPSAERLPFGRKTPPGRLGSPSPIVPVIGAQAHSIRDMEAFMRTVVDADPWVYYDGVISVPWRRVDAPSRPLRFGFILEDPKRPMHPVAMRAMTQAKEKLQKAGHEIVEFHVGSGDALSIPSIYDCALLAWRFFLLDSTKTALRFIQAGEEEVIASLKACSFAELKDWKPTLEELFDIIVERKKVMDIYRRLWTYVPGKDTTDKVASACIDGIIVPTYQGTAQPHDSFGLPIYTVLANLLDYPAIHIPFLNANKELDKPFIRDNVTYVPPYDANAVEGAPFGVQVFGRPMKDEELLHVAEIVDKVLKGE